MTDDKMHQVLEALYLYTTAIMPDKSLYREQLYNLLEELSEGTDYSPAMILDAVRTTHFPDYFRQRVQRDQSGL
jgi:hypothetical protein